MKRDIAGLEVQDMQASFQQLNQTLITQQNEILQLKNENARLVIQLVEAKKLATQPGISRSHQANDLDKSKGAKADQHIELLLTLLNAAEATVDAQARNSMSLVAVVDALTACLTTQAAQIAELKVRLAEIEATSSINKPQ